jgi:hypothetical protein
MSKLSALAAFLDVDDGEIVVKEDGYGSFCIGEEEYRVIADDEALGSVDPALNAVAWLVKDEDNAIFHIYQIKPLLRGAFRK